MNPELQLFVDKLQAVRLPEDLFGRLDGSPTEQHRYLKGLYRRFAFVCHEDKHVAADKPAAQLAFVRLNALYEEAQQRIDAKKYGSPVLTYPAGVKTKRGTYDITRGFAAGDLTTLYHAKLGGAEYLLKLAAHTRDNDLLEVEHKTLVKFHESIKIVDLKALPELFPKIVESCVVKAGTARRLNVFEHRPNYVPLTELVSYFPAGVDPRHFVWIFRRLLTAIGYAHMNGYVHGAVLPTHVLIRPDTHDLQLIDWCYATDINSKIRAVSTGYQDWYPPEVMKRERATAATDIYMAARCVAYVLGGDHIDVPPTVPEVFRNFLTTCLWPAAARRPQDAWALYDTFSELAKKVYGKRKFVPLELRTM